MVAPFLSILIPTLTDRVDKLKRQLERIGSGVEVIYLGDNRYISTGKKRNVLLSLASGEYSCFIDDDDLISEDFCSEVLKAIESNPNVTVINYEVQITTDGKRFKPVLYSKNYTNETRGAVYFRKPNHLMVWKTEIAKQIPYLDLTVGEDTIWAQRAVNWIESEYIIDKPLYKYYALEGRHNSCNS